MKPEQNIKNVIDICEGYLQKRGTLNVQDILYFEAVRDTLAWVLEQGDHPLQDYIGPLGRQHGKV